MTNHQHTDEDFAKRSSGLTSLMRCLSSEEISEKTALKQVFFYVYKIASFNKYLTCL